MKRQISYLELKNFGRDVARYIKDKYPDGNYNLIAVARGGLTLAHIVAYILAKPLNFFIPKTGGLHFAEQGDLNASFIFLEDLIAKGRTYEIIEKRMELIQQSWEFIPVVVDADIEIPKHVSKYMIQTSDWMVFPHEDFDSTVEKDWGLFRDGSSSNSKAII